MWSETVGLRTGQDRSQTKNVGLGLGLGLAVVFGLGLHLACLLLCCYGRYRNDLEAHSNFSTTI